MNALDRTWNGTPRVLVSVYNQGYYCRGHDTLEYEDLTGRLINAQKEAKADQWEVIEFPAILPNNKPVWPEY